MGGGYYGGYGHGIYKREAEASFGYGSTAGYHPGGGISYSNRSPQGLSAYRGYGGYGYGHGNYKRSAEPSYYGGYYGSGVSFQRVSRPYSGYGVDVYHGWSLKNFLPCVISYITKIN